MCSRPPMKWGRHPGLAIKPRFAASFCAWAKTGVECLNVLAQRGPHRNPKHCFSVFDPGFSRADNMTAASHHSHRSKVVFSLEAVGHRTAFIFVRPADHGNLIRVCAGQGHQASADLFGFQVGQMMKKLREGSSKDYGSERPPQSCAEPGW